MASLVSPHPPWCSGDDVPAGRGVIHISHGQDIGHSAHLNIERLDPDADTTGTSAIRLQGNDDLLTAMEALQLGLTLQVYAVVVLAERRPR